MVIPGSAIKGRLRSQAEKIALTLRLERQQAEETQGPDTQSTQSSDRDRFLKQLNRVPLSEILFGIPGPKKQPGGSEQPETRGLGLGAVMVDDCFAENRSVEPKQWEKLVAAPKDDNDGMRHVLGALNAMHGAEPGNSWAGDEPATHVAIDRWTGGAAAKMLYSALEPRGVKWAPIEIEVALDRLKAPPRLSEQSAPADPELWRAAAVALLFLTLRDFALGRIPLGFGGNRGYGAVTVIDIAFQWIGSSVPSLKSIADLHGLKIQADGKISDEDATRMQGLQESWSRYLTERPARRQTSSNTGSQQ
jgi:CRISPR/Cas system CSM-associated protein Csm3 (group 7 of RAMP superfamily)